MFNVTVIRLKDIIKIIAIVIIIYVLSKFVFSSVPNQNGFSQSININTTELIKLGINTESSIFKNVLNYKEAETEKTEEVEADFKNISAKSILNIGSNIFKTNKQEQIVGQDLNQVNENTETNTNSEEQKTAQMPVATTDVNTQVVTQNPITEKYNREFDGIKIKNETSYELTDNMLNINDLNINVNDIIIFHTHTCESYTQTEKYQYEASRKL